jgi:Protein of unknown function (DUF3499)
VLSRHDAASRSRLSRTAAPWGYGAAVRHVRRCSRTGCGHSAVATLTYVYADSTAVVGPLATYAEPHSYDLCEEHARRLTAPKGWEVVRHEGDYPMPLPSTDDLEALANAVREAARSERPTAPPVQDRDPVDDVAPRRGHLRVLPSPP